MSSSPRAPGLARRVRNLLADMVELTQVRLELLAVEARLELARLLQLVASAMLALVLLSFGLVFLAVFLTVALWDTPYRLLVLGICTTAFLGGALVLGLMARQQLRGAKTLFGVSREELRRDSVRLRDHEEP